MRKAEGKELGYVILPVGVPTGLTPSEALNDNEKFRVVWEILNALRAHDDRFNANINKMEYGGDMSEFIEVVAVTEQLRDERDTGKNERSSDIGGEGYGDESNDALPSTEQQFGFDFDDFQQALSLIHI